MSIADHLAELGALLEALKKTDLGYPLGDNAVRSPLPPEQVEAIIKGGPNGVGSLRELYMTCNGVSLPDIHVGYFIKPFPRVVSFNRSSEPDVLRLDRDLPILPIGSTGGGDLFVADVNSRRVLLLPPGPLRDGIYDGRQAKIRVAANTLDELVSAIVSDTRAFLNRDSSHRYLNDPKAGAV
jgi:hypothetical protein